MQEIYLISHFTWQGKKSYDLPLMGLSLKERVLLAYPESRLFLDEERGQNGENLLGISLQNFLDYPIVCAKIRRDILLSHLRNNVLITDMDSVYIEEGASIESGVVIKHGSYIERNTFIGSGSVVGPYAYLRQGAKVGHGCRVGDFTEIKNATVGDRTKVAHLAYVGDADVGADCNVGCGVVFVNYDGRKKNRTTIGDGSFIGSNVNLVAPLQVGKKAYIACGSTVTSDLNENDFCIARSRQTVKPYGAKGRF